MKELHLQFIQKTINRYAWQSAIFKIAVFLVASLTFTGIIVSDFMGGEASILVSLVAMFVFLVWLQDGYANDLKLRYCKLFESCQTQEDNNGCSMSLEAEKGIAAGSLWRTSLTVFYVPVITALVLITLTI